jgi:hypothetical protein
MSEYGFVITEKTTADGYKAYTIGWLNVAQSVIEAYGEKEILLSGLDTGFDVMTKGGSGILRDNLVEETMSGYYLLYKHFIVFRVHGKKPMEP